MAREISNSDDIIDSRDVIARIEELESEMESGCENDSENDDVEQYIRTVSGDEKHDLHDEAVELLALRELASDMEGYCSDWKHGATLIRDSYFEDYARELASDIGAIDRNASWPNDCIDWERAARELQMDYTSAEFDGVTYWVR